MATQRSIQISRRIYARLLGVYPAGHRADYGADMLQLFTDQCRDAAQAGERLAFFRLWLRTLGDLLVSALREHLIAPHAWAGLLEAPPNAPLPWKGTALVLLPGLIFFIAQVAQLTGQDWFFLLVYRAAYFMILPVLVVWAWKRKFPIWGLIPLGLLAKTVMVASYGLPYRARYSPNPVMAWIWRLLEHTPRFEFEVASVVLVLLISLVLLWRVQRRAGISGAARNTRAGIPGAAWGGLAAYLLVVVFLCYRDVQPFLQSEYFNEVPKDELPAYIFDIMYYNLLNYGVLLALILLGALMARRHGRLAVLLPLGYLLPTLIYGRVSDDWPSMADPSFTFMISVSAAALAYRFMVALAGPLWIVRSASGKMRQRASTISLLALVGIQAAFNVSLLLNSVTGAGRLEAAYYLITQQLPLLAAVIFALTLYRAVPAITLPPIRQREEAVS